MNDFILFILFYISAHSDPPPTKDDPERLLYIIIRCHNHERTAHVIYACEGV